MSRDFLMRVCVWAVAVLANAYQKQPVARYKPQAFAVIAREHQQKTNILSSMYYGPTFGLDAAIALLTPKRVFLHMLMPPDFCNINNDQFSETKTLHCKMLIELLVCELNQHFTV